MSDPLGSCNCAPHDSGSQTRVLQKEQEVLLTVLPSFQPRLFPVLGTEPGTEPGTELGNDL